MILNLLAMSADLGLPEASLTSLLLVGAAAMILSFVVCAGFFILMPADYFSLRRHPPTDKSRPLGTIIFCLRNFIGALLIVVGLVLSLPAIPFPGLLLVLIGFSITDFSSKRRVQRMILKRRSIQGRINSLRKKFGKSPIVLGC